MKNKLIAFSDQETIWIQKEASLLEVSFTEMVRRIIYERYNKPLQPNNITDSTEAPDGGSQS